MSGFEDWIKANTQGSWAVVEFGAMFGDILIHAASHKKIGIEIHQPYIDKAKLPLIRGDFREFEKLIAPEDMDCALFVDSLEHIEKEEAFDLIKRVQARFVKIILAIPEGEHPQDKDIYDMGADEYQTHRSVWHVEDIQKMGFQHIDFRPEYHEPSPGKSRGAIFAIWWKI